MYSSNITTPFDCIPGREMDLIEVHWTLVQRWEHDLFELIRTDLFLGSLFNYVTEQSNNSANSQPVPH